MSTPDGGADRSPLRYPTRYPLKIFGVAAEDFTAHVQALVERAGGVEPVEPPTVRASQGGKYLAVTVVVELTSESQRLAIYQALRIDARVVYAL